MIDIRHLINFLPFSYKGRDTYKDEEGKGLLEKFLDICGNYFTDNIKEVIDNSLDILDIDTTSTQYLEWLWEILGQLPFALNPGKPPLILNNSQQRSLIKYGNALIKIRGSKEFFEVLFRMYNNSYNQLRLESINIEDFGWDVDPYRNTEDIWSYFDSDNFDDDIIAHDEYHRMKQCIKASFYVTCNSQLDLIEVYDSIKKLLDKYVPYNVTPLLYLNGTYNETEYPIRVEVYENGKWVQTDEVTLREGQVIKARAWIPDEFGDVKKDSYFISRLADVNKPLQRSEGLYEFYISNVLGTESTPNSDTYLFSSYDFRLNSKLKVNRAEGTYIKYYIELIPGNNILSNVGNNNKEATCQILAYSYETNSNGAIINKRSVSISCEQTYETKTPQEGSYTTSWSFDKPGNYTFIIVGHNSYRVSFKVVNSSVMPVYKAMLRECIKTVKGVWEESGSTNDESILNLVGDKTTNLAFKVKLSCNDSRVKPEDLKFYIEGNPLKVYPNNTILNPMGFDIYDIIPIPNYPGDIQKATLVVSSRALNISLNIDKRYNVDYVLDENGKVPVSVDKISNYVKSVGIDVKASGNNQSSNNLINKGLDFIVELPYTHFEPLPNDPSTVKEVYSVEISRGGHIELEHTIIDYPTNQANGSNIFSITSDIEGSYKIYPKAYKYSYITWTVYNIKTTATQVPEGVILIPILNDPNQTGWSGGETPNASYQLSSKYPEAIFKLCCYYTTDDGYIQLMGNGGLNVEANNNKGYELSTEYTETTPQNISFRVYFASNSKFKDGTSEKIVTLNIKDFTTEIDLSCVPSKGVLNNKSVSTKLKISSNKPELKLGISAPNGDVYEDGDTYEAYEPGIYTFKAIVNGVIDYNSTCQFEVIDPEQVTATPESISFEADGTPTRANGNIINILTGYSTEWTLEIEEDGLI